MPLPVLPPPVNDPEYSYYQIMRATPQPDPVPPLPDYDKQGDGQRCVQQGTLVTPFSPQTEEQCWRMCSNKDGTPQPNTYFNVKTASSPRECYCVGPVCDVVSALSIASAAPHALVDGVLPLANGVY